MITKVKRLRKITLTLLSCFISFLANRGIAQETLFTSIPSEVSQINFENTLEDTREANILLYSNYYGGGGLAIADLDNDGFQDIYFAGNLVGDRLYRNLGNMVFEDVTTKAGIMDKGEWSSTVIVGDVNGDGLQDIYVTCELYDDKPELRKNKLYVNKGDMKFSEEAEAYGLADSERSRGATFIDYDKDGWLDLYVLNQPPNPGNYSPYSGQDLLKYEWGSRLYKNNGDNTFTDVSMSAGVARPSYPNSVIAADIDKDGWQDLYVTNDYEAPDFYYRNNGDGTFTNVIDDAMRHISYYAMGVDAADINNDGLLDLMTLDMVAEDNFRLKRNMSGMNPKLFWKLVSQGAHYQYMYNALHLNQGKNIFSDIAQLSGMSSTDWSWSNVIADFDNDGWKDAYITNGLLRDIRNTDMASKFPEFIQQSIAEFVKENPNAGEVDILDVIDIKKGMELHPSVPLKNYAFKNSGDLSFENKTEEWGLDIPSFSNGCAYGDLDNDGDLDLVVNNINAKAFVYRNNSDLKKNSHYFRILLENENYFSLLGTRAELVVNGSHQFSELTSSRGMYSSSESILHFGLGENNQVDSLIITWPDGSRQILTDIVADQTISIKDDKEKIRNRKLRKKVLFTEVNPMSMGIDFKHKENEFDDYSVQVLLPHKMSQLGPAVAVSDVNNDGRDDFFIGGAQGQASVLYIQDATGNFYIKNQDWILDSLYEDVASLFLDIDNDGDQDLYVVSGGNAHAPRNKNYLDRLYLNDGSGTFTKSPNSIPRLLESGAKVVSIDYDKDGDQDLFIAGRHQPWDYPRPTISRLLRNDKGIFTDVTKSYAKVLINIGMVTDVIVEDYNHDDLEDLIIVGEWMPITFLKNTGSEFIKDEKEFFAENGKVKTDGWWNAIKSLDLDGDGDKDYVVGNLGKNYKYKASQKEPFSVFYNDMDKNGKNDIILSYYNFGEVYPLRGRSCSAQQIPDLKKEFPSYDIFASTDLYGVYDSTELISGLHYDAYMFESIMLYDEGDSRFRIEPLENSAQLSSINSIVDIDLDKQNGKEIILAGNMYQSEVETPRNDASIGVVLKQTNNQWKLVETARSSLYLSNDIRALAPLVINEHQHLLVISNNDKLRLLKIKN
jgi:hypothetical protein